MSELMEKKESDFEQDDIDNNKTMAGLAYLIFFLPLLVCPQSKYAKFHANQALLLFIVSVAGSIVLNVIPIYMFYWLVFPVFSLAIFVLAVVGLVNGFSGKANRLPIIGKYDILK